jgi:Zn-dependent protease with chaperone function
LDGIDLVRPAVWKMISLYIPLLIVSLGIEDLQSHRLAGLLWLLLAGVTAFMGTRRLRSAEGIKLRAVKSGELYKRALVLSKRAEVQLRQVCVVPFGRGRLSNAYGGGRRIAVTDDYGHWLHGRQLDFVIGHELTHVKHQHGLKKLAAIVGIFGAAGIAMLWFPNPSWVWKVVVSFSAMLVPLIGVHFVSRRFEYAADRGALELTGDAEAGIRSLADLYARTGVPVTCTWIEEVFSTHPTLLHRIGAITQAASPG